MRIAHYGFGKRCGASTSASALLTDADDACNGVELAQSGDTPVPFLQLTEEEAGPRDDGRTYELRPVGGLVHQGKGYLFYEHYLLGEELDAELLGTGLCISEADTHSCERVVVDGSSILWTDRTLDQGGLVVDDRAVIFGCRKVATFSRPCIANGVDLDRLDEPDAYQVWNDFDGWSDDPAAATVITDALASVTVSPFAGAYLETLVGVFGGPVIIRRSAQAPGPFEREIDTFQLVDSDSFIRGGREHSGLRRHPTEIHVSYVTDGGSAPGLHLASYRFHGPEIGGSNPL